ncbi:MULTISPECIES: gephyrin-like molybdotransferase Glp [unclassified Sporosarcina]|uniref:molybdopterin molybdotransferase MoeA n=1 Tax=unclassified Sporosarcina TaxID=2647733 RepID=UPI00203CF6AA|nr:MULTISPECIES: gephyrin-like molybdotransferase Glp [unclassified Sporosarcina]GKV65159.1 molybdopterin molybdenumtransferase [Sporosarcina sp. NCCP-2331]GLB55283.1 molybdopterin molybdenumtransferase [Sporosarcina sp. NCCP-2378]
MVEIRKPIQVAEAVERVMAHVHKLGTEILPLEETYGRVLAEPIIAKHDVPPFDRSPYDGFAIRAADSAGASGEKRKAFRVIGEIGAGHVADRAVEAGESYRIMTGAIIPEQANAVVMLEQTVENETGFTLRKPFEAGENISRQGEDAKKGEQLIEAGTVIHPGTIALLATFGYSEVKVAKQPVAGVLSTGTELLDVSDELVPGKIRNSNGPMIHAQLTRMGIESKAYGMMEDDLDACTEIVEHALKETDLLITTGGVSVGDYDYLPAIYERLGAEVLFNKVAMRPGSVTTVAVLGDKLLFGLSGNPSACFSGFELFTRPAILSMMGCTAPYLPRIQAILGDDFKKPNPFTRFIRASWDMTPQGITATPAGFNKSSAVSSIARGNCIIVLPSGTRGYEKGTQVDVLLLGTEQGTERWEL